MTLKFGHPNRSHPVRTQRMYDHFRYKLSLRNRIDGILLILFTIFVVSLASFTLFWVVTGSRLGWFDAPLIQLLADNRILQNVRDDLNTRPILDAQLHLPINRVVFSQTGGSIHFYNPETGLWTTEQPFSTTTSLNSDLVMLRSGCGADHHASLASTCPDPDPLWAVSRSGGLARRSHGQWEVLVSDTIFVGSDGLPVQSADLTSAAVSDDLRWLALGTRAAGVGLYNRDYHEWVPLSTAGALPDPAVTHLVWWQGQFWIGGPKGLATLLLQTDSPVIQPVFNFQGAILDLQVLPSGELMALARRDCQAGGPNCLWVGQLDQPGNVFTVLLEEANLYPKLNLNNLIYAGLQDERVTVAGDAGLYTYDPQLHSWQRWFDFPIGAVLPLPSTTGNLSPEENRSTWSTLFFSHSKGLGRLIGSEVKDWPTPDLPLTELKLGPNDLPLALSQRGSVFGLNAADEIIPVFPATASEIDPKTFAGAVHSGDQVVFFGSEGWLIHNLSERTYENIAKEKLPEWGQEQGSQWVMSGDQAYIVSANGLVRTLSIAQLSATSAYTVTQMQPVSPIHPDPELFSKLWAWTPNNLGMLTPSGTIFNYSPDARSQKVGPPRPDLEKLVWKDVTPDPWMPADNGLLLTAPQGVFRYSGDNRSWSESALAAPTDDPVVELASFQGQALGVNSRNQLVRLEEDPRVLIGEQGFTLDSATISDALLHSGLLYLAGGGRIDQYDMSARSVTQSWQTAGLGALSIKAILPDGPLTWDGSQAFCGSREIDPVAGQVYALSTGLNHVWTVRSPVNGPPYLKTYPINDLSSGQAQCFFRQPVADGVSTILDARLLRPGVVAAISDAGLWFYDLNSRTWRKSGDRAADLARRIYALDNLLVLADAPAERFDLGFIASDTVTFPKSCDIGPADIKITKETVRAYTVYEAAKRFAYIAGDGSVFEWSHGQSNRILPPESDSPPSDELRRFFQREDIWFFTTASGQLWQYTPSTRVWESIRLDYYGLDPLSNVDVNLEHMNGVEFITARFVDGQIFLGQMTNSDRQITMKLIYKPQPGFNQSAGFLRDVKEIGGLWAFVMADQIRYFDPQKRTWQSNGPVFDNLDITRGLRVDGRNRQVIVADGGATWWIAQDITDAPACFSRYQVPSETQVAIMDNGDVLQVNNDGQLMRCTFACGEEYKCSADPSGTSFTPLTSLIRSNGYLMAKQVNSLVPLGVSGTLAAELRRLPALEVGWLFWNVNRGVFRVATPDGTIELSPEQMSPDNVLLFEPIDGILAMASDQIYAGNRYGIWQYRNSDLWLTDPGIRFQPLQWMAPSVAAHGRFFSGQMELKVDTNQFNSLPVAMDTRIGSIIFQESVTLSPLIAVVEMSNGSTSAWAKTGFAWDANRRGLAYDGENLLIQSNNLILHAGSLDGFERPNGDMVDRASLLGETGRAYLFDGANWLIRDASGWNPSVNPGTNRSLFSDATWTWSLDNAQRLQVMLNGARHNFHFIWDGGLGFNFDQLVSAAAIDGQLWVATDAFVETTNQVAAISGLTAERLPPMPTDIQFEFFPQQGPALYSFSPTAGIHTWDAAIGQFKSAPDNPRQNRLLVDTPRLRFSRENGVLLKRVSLNLPTGGQYWALFDLDSGRFPFDVIQSAAIFDGSLYLGGRAGLQVYPSAQGFALDTSSEWLYPSLVAAGSLLSVDRVGIPNTQPDRLAVIGPGGCIERQLGGAYQACTQPAPLDQRLRVVNPLWRWIKQSDDTVFGDYLDGSGAVVGDRISMMDGRLPHDRLVDIRVCAGKTYSLLQDSRVMEHTSADQTTVLNMGSRSALYPSPAIPLQQLECVADAEPFPGGNLPAGLYAQDNTGRIWFLAIGGWQIEGDAQVADAVRFRIESPTVLNAGRLRVISNTDGMLLFEHRGQDDTWNKLPWELEPGALERWRVAIDLWDTIHFYNQELWVGTSQGLVTFDLRDDGRAILDLEHARIVREPQLEGRACSIQDIEISPDGQALVRCAPLTAGGPEPVYQGNLAIKSDYGIFTPFTDPNPFSTRTLISAADGRYWEWRLEGHQGGAQGYLVVNLIPAGEQAPEPVQITGGRFAFDAISSMAAFFDDNQLEVVGGTGWFSVPLKDFHLSGWKRRNAWPDILPVQVNQVRLTRLDDEPLLCLGMMGGAGNAAPARASFLRLSRNGQVNPAANCSQFMGFDGLWQYEIDQQTLSAFARNARGANRQRQLVNGRFTDDRLLGPPATGWENTGLYYLYPTQAGVLKLDKSFRATRLDSAPFAGMSVGVPSAVQIFNGQEVYAGSTGLFALDDLQTALTITYQLPAGGAILDLGVGSYDTVQIRWHIGSERHWTLIDPASQGVIAIDTVPVDITNFAKYLENQLTWGSNAAIMHLQFSPGQIDSLADPQRLFKLEFPTSLSLVTPILWQDRLYIVGEQELYQVGLSQVVLGLLGK